MPVDAALPRLCFFIEVRQGSDALARAERALESKAVATLILAPPSGGTLTADSAQPIVAMAQNMGVATLIQDDAHLAVATGADGVHITWHDSPLQAYEETRKLLGKNAIVGADAGHSRHDAMELGESGADYVAFGLPTSAADRESAALQQLDLVGWWAEVFEIPVVGLDVQDAREVQSLTECGADFLAARIPLDIPEHAVTAWVSRLQRAAAQRTAE